MQSLIDSIKTSDQIAADSKSSSVRIPKRKVVEVSTSRGVHFSMESAQAPLPPDEPEAVAAESVEEDGVLPVSQDIQTLLAKKNRWEMREHLGRGAMGDVYTAYDRNLRMKSALKLYDPRFTDGAARETGKKRFIREGKALAKINNPYVARLFDFDVSDSGAAFLAMRLIDGEDLERRMLGEGPLDAKDASRIGLDIAKGLEAMHAAGVVHRDLKPANIVYSNEAEHHVIVDFGLVSLLADPRQEWDKPSGKSKPERARLTDAGFAMGTAHYIAPEQVIGRKTITPAADVWALGVILFELTTGQLPFELSPNKDKPLSAVEYVSKVVNEEAPAVTDVRPELPADFTQLVMSMMEKNPKDRPTVEEVLVELEELAGEKVSDRKQAKKRESKRPVYAEKNVETDSRRAETRATPTDSLSKLNEDVVNRKQQAKKRVDKAFLDATPPKPVTLAVPPTPKPVPKDALPWRIWNHLLGRK
jgi:serine/threonine protein kinase